jgi:hypothetical protein
MTSQSRVENKVKFMNMYMSGVKKWPNPTNDGARHKSGGSNVKQLHQFRLSYMDPYTKVKIHEFLHKRRRIKLNDFIW